MRPSGRRLGAAQPRARRATRRADAPGPPRLRPDRAMTRRPPGRTAADRGLAGDLGRRRPLDGRARAPPVGAEPEHRDHDEARPRRRTGARGCRRHDPAAVGQEERPASGRSSASSVQEHERLPGRPARWRSIGPQRERRRSTWRVWPSSDQTDEPRAAVGREEQQPGGQDARDRATERAGHPVGADQGQQAGGAGEHQPHRRRPRPVTASGVVRSTGSGFHDGPPVVSRSRPPISRPHTSQAHGS